MSRTPRSKSSRAIAWVVAALGLIAIACGSDGSDGSDLNARDVDQLEAVADAGDKASPGQNSDAAESTGPGDDQADLAAASNGDARSPVAEATSVPTTAPILQPTPTPVPRPASPSGRVAPTVASTAAGLAEQVAEAERGLLAPDSTPRQRADWGHLHQVAIRKLGYEPGWDIEFFAALPAEFRARTGRHVEARRALIDLSSGYSAADFIPAWEIVEPESADNLLGYYQSAEEATGIEWEYLAGINLIETGMGRIRGLSSAGAQGPMQFLPTTWDEAGIGEGDINDPNDAINAAARYLVRRGGPADIAGAIWGYNNSDDYVTAVQAYAALLRDDPAAYAAIYNWEIYFYTEAGDVWLPSGFRSEQSIDLVDYLADNPWSVPDPGLR